MIMAEGRRYTRVYCNEGMRSYFPDVRTGQRAQSVEVSGAFPGSPAADRAWVTVSDDSLWWLDAVAPDQAAARALAAAGSHQQLTKIHIREGRLEAEQHTSAGFRAYVVIAVEPPPGAEA
jgi:hypothetical protein